MNRRASSTPISTGKVLPRDPAKSLPSAKACRAGESAPRARPQGRQVHQRVTRFLNAQLCPLCGEAHTLPHVNCVTQDAPSLIPHVGQSSLPQSMSPWEPACHLQVGDGPAISGHLPQDLARRSRQQVCRAW